MLKIFALATGLAIACSVQANDEKYKATPLVGNNGSNNPLRKDSVSTVTDTAYFSATLNPLIGSSRVRNLVTFRINEYANIVLPASFTAKIKFRVDLYTSTTSYTTVYDSLTLNYSNSGSYNRLQMFTRETGYKTVVTLTDDIIVTGATAAEVLPALVLDNEIWVSRQYNFTCSSGIQSVSFEDYSDKSGDLRAIWPFQPTATEYDLEWAYIDSTARANYYHNGNTTYDPEKIFTNNATRVSVTGTSYLIPLMYDNGGLLFFRVRPVQVLPGNQRLEAVWSSTYNDGMGMFEFGGHERGLNWQSTTSFAEEGKRKTVVQYFDGTLRSRQTVTKDNTTGTTVVAETFYDYQGRPVIQALPSPTIEEVIKHSPGFNQFAAYSTQKDNYDPVITNTGILCSSAASAMKSDFGAGKYYSPQNPLVNNADETRFIPNANGYPFTETQYSTDGTDRVLKQSGVGSNFHLNSGRETRYYYGTAEQEDLDLLFGTEAGVASHYSKNMVRDANGQYSISYMDMHGRTVATALAGDHPAGMDTLLSKNTRTITKPLLDAQNNIVQGNQVTSTKTFLVPRAGNQRFRYSLWPDSLSSATCYNTTICYDCQYDLEISIWGECYNNSTPVIIRRSNLRLNPADTLCGTANLPLAVDTTVFLPEGDYTVTKTLTVSRTAFEYLRDSVYLKKNLCKTEADFVKEALDSIKANTQCERTCNSCSAELGSWESFREKYMSANDIAPIDSASFRSEALQAWLELKAECDELCENRGLHKNIRDAMLTDLTPPSGQFADLNAIDEFSIFRRTGQLMQGLKYYQIVFTYKDETGKPDTVTNNAGQRVVPNQLTPEEFVQQFKPSWAETLLPLHPEYCKLQQVEATPFPQSDLWDAQFAAENSYSTAINKGWLNPTANGNTPFNRYPLPSTADRDPFFAAPQMGGWRAELEDSIKHKISLGNNQYISLWALATLAAKCNDGDAACYDTYKNDNYAMDSTLLCRSEVNKAWEMFRNIYLQEKREIIFKMLKAACPNTPRLTDPHYSHFPDTDRGAALVNSYPATGSVRDSINALIDANCRAYTLQWWRELAPCNIPVADSAYLINKLITVCKEGGDSSRPFGSSTVRPASASSDRSFEQVLKDYCTAHNISYSVNCNAYLISAPRAYEQQNVLADDVVLTKPDSCQCARMEEYRAKYLRYKLYGESFAAYLKRTINSNLRSGELDTLQKACNGTLGCKFLTEPILLPPAFQCAVNDVCLDCIAVRKLEQKYYVQFPNATPKKEPANETEEKNNRTFMAFMNYYTGFNKTTYEYLVFLDGCAALPSAGCDSLLEIAGNYHHFGNSVRVNYGVQTEEGANYEDPDEVVANGYLRFPDSLRLHSRNWYNNIYMNFAPYLCFPNGYETEVRLKILNDIPYYLSSNVYYLNFLNAMPLISRYVTPVAAYGQTFPPGMYLETIYGTLPGQNSFVPINADTNSIFQWQTVRTKITPSQVSLWFNGKHVVTLNRDANTPLVPLNTTVFGIRSRLGAVDYLKIRDHNGQLVYFENFDNTQNPAVPDSNTFCFAPANCESAFTSYFNTVKGTSYTYAQIQQQYLQHCGYMPEICSPHNGGPQLCGKLEPTFPGVTVYPTACSDSLEQAAETGAIWYAHYKDSVTTAFENAYMQKCLQNASKESFTITQTMSEYHYTLYYYDQAGALVKTVPPQGVDYWFNKLKTDAAYGNGNYETGVGIWLNEVKTARQNNTLKNIAYHLTTSYRFNTLAQVVQQKSPDGGLSKFWYDRLGRLVVSQNARQAAFDQEIHRQYSYTGYDYLGRITEVGRLSNNTGNAMSQAISRDTTALKNWLASNAARKAEVTRTYYDAPPPAGLVNTEFTPRNLRNRVSYTTLTDSNATAAAGYNYAAFYTYDIHGNVDTLVQDYGLGTAPPAGSFNIPNVMNMNGNRFKKIVYAYDLISGKVNLVQYSPGKADRFYHRYEYDAENRITDVLTSADSLVWERDARYQYYKHGPLARMVLGEQQVQGVDYAYAIQGWLKGVNSTGNTTSSAVGTYDLGGDGLTTGSNRYVAQDALAFALHYFDGDYSPINNSLRRFAPVNENHLAGQYRPLYNGNISSMAVSIGQFGNTWLYNYKYDQLNRIREMDVYKTGYNAATNRWGGGTTGEDPLDASEDYKERVNYDANGNILAYLRNKDYGAAGRDMDNLKYWYQYKTSSGSVGHFDPAAALPTNIAELTNKLGYVDDAVAADKSAVDIDDQASGNYSYDEIGNLVADAQEGITSIKWSVYGKILEINRAQRSPLADSIKKIAYTYDAAGNRIGKIVERYATSRIDYTWYVRDAQGNAMGVYSYSSASGLSAGTLRLNETPLYGSSRLGILNRDIDVEQPLGVINIANFERGSKFFELSNHLGNVLVAVSDRKVPANTTVGAIVTYYKPVVIAANDYYPFGMMMPGRNYNNVGFKDYRYGFNGKENDNDVKGVEGSQQDYGMRIYDPRLGKFLSVDPIAASYPWYTPYQFAGNKPINSVDLDGLEEVSVVTGPNGNSPKIVANSNYKPTDKGALLFLKPAFKGIVSITDATGKIPNKTFEGNYFQLWDVDKGCITRNIIKSLMGEDYGTSASRLDITITGTRTEISKSWKGTNKNYYTQYGYSLFNNNVTEKGSFELPTSVIQASARAWDPAVFLLLNKVLSSVVITLTKTSVSATAEELVTLHRSISKAEAESIRNTQKLSFAEGQMEVKQFWQTPEGLNNFNASGFGGEYNLEMTVPKSLLGKGKALNTAVQVDESLGSSATIDNVSQLNIVNQNIRSLKIIPIK